MLLVSGSLSYICTHDISGGETIAISAWNPLKSNQMQMKICTTGQKVVKSLGHSWNLGGGEVDPILTLVTETFQPLFWCNLDNFELDLHFLVPNFGYWTLMPIIWKTGLLKYRWCNKWGHFKCSSDLHLDDWTVAALFSCTSHELAGKSETGSGHHETKSYSSCHHDLLWYRIQCQQTKHSRHILRFNTINVCNKTNVHLRIGCFFRLSVQRQHCVRIT